MAYIQRDDQARDDGQPAGARPRRRTRNQERRGRTVRFALTDTEYAELSDAARHAGLARGAFAAEAALSVARGAGVTPDAPLRDAFYALDRAALLVRKIGVNLNQAVAKLNSTGQRSGDLLGYAQESERRAARLEAAGEDLRKLARSAIRVRGRRRRTAGPPASGPQSARRSRMTAPSPATTRPARTASRPSFPASETAFPASETGRNGRPRGPGFRGWHPAAWAEQVPDSLFPMPLAGDR